MLLLCLYLVFENHQTPPNIFYDVVVNYNQEQICAVSVMSKTHFGLDGIHSYYFKSDYRKCDVYAMSFGNTLYRENLIRAGFRFNVRHACNILIRVTGLNYWIKDHCARFNYALSTGIAWRRGPLSLRTEIRNFNIPRFSLSDYIPILLSVQCIYAAESSLTILGTVQSTQGQVPSYNFGVQMMPHSQVIIGAGAVTDPPGFDYMFSLILGRMLVSYFGNAHVVLGLSHALAIGVRL